MTKLNQNEIGGLSLTNKEVDAIIGRNIKSRRVALGISQTNLADELGITFQQVQKYEKGINRVGGSRMHHTAVILNCREQDFFAGLKKNSIALDAAMKTVLDYRDSPQGAQVIKLMATMQDPAIRKRVVALMKSLNPQE